MEYLVRDCTLIWSLWSTSLISAEIMISGIWANPWPRWRVACCFADRKEASLLYTTVRGSSTYLSWRAGNKGHEGALLYLADTLLVSSSLLSFMSSIACSHLGTSTCHCTGVNLYIKICTLLAHSHKAAAGETKGSYPGEWGNRCCVPGAVC